MRRLLALALALVVPACGSDSPTAPVTTVTTTTTLPLVARAVVAVSAQNNTFTVRSSERVVNEVLQCGDYHIEWVFSESAGLGARIVSSEVYLRAPDGSIEGRSVQTRNDAIPALGRFVGFSDRSTCGYVGRSLPDVIVGKWTVTDERGNSATLDATVGFVPR